MKDFGFCERWILDGVWLCEVFVNWTMMEGSNEVVMEEIFIFFISILKR